MSQRQIFSSTPRKRIYLWNTGQGTLKSQQSQTTNLSDSVNPAASRVYNVVLWSSENTKHTSKKTGTAAKKKSKENTCATNSQNSNKDDIFDSGTCNKSELKTGSNLDGEEEKENKNPNGSRRERRDTYKSHVNKEIQKWFTQSFNDNNQKNSQQNQRRATENSKRLDRKPLKDCQKNYRCSSRDAGTKNKVAKNVKSSSQLDPSQVYEFAESPNVCKSKATPKKSKATPKKSIATPGKSKATPKKSQSTPKKPKATPGKSKATPGKSKATPGKSNSKSEKKKDPKDDSVVNEILNVISQTKIEIESMKAQILKQKTKHK